MQIGKHVFARTLRDCCFMTTTEEICIIKNVVLIRGNTYFIVNKFQSRRQVYDAGYPSDFVGVHNCYNLSNEHEIVPMNDVKAKVYRMPRWKSREGQEELTIKNEYICVTMLTSLVLPNN